MTLGSLGARLRLGLSTDTTLGTVLERLAAVHGEPPAGRGGRAAPPLVATGRPPPRSTRGPAASPRPSERGDRVVVATPNTYDQFLLSLAASRAGGHRRARSTPACAPTRSTTSIADAGAAARASASAAERRRRRQPLASRRRRRPPATSPRSSTPRAPRASRRASSSPTAGCSAACTSARWCLALQLRRDEAVDLAADRPHHGVRHARRPGRCRHPDLLPAPLPPRRRARRHRAAPGHRVRRRARPCTGCCSRPAPSSATCRACGRGARVPTSCRPNWPTASASWAPRPACRSSAPVGDAIFFEGYGLAESGGCGGHEGAAAARRPAPARRQRRHAAARLPDEGRRRGRPGPCAPVRSASCWSRAQASRRATGATRRPPTPCSRPTAGCAPATWPAPARSARCASPGARST